MHVFSGAERGSEVVGFRIRMRSAMRTRKLVGEGISGGSVQNL